MPVSMTAVMMLSLARSRTAPARPGKISCSVSLAGRGTGNDLKAASVSELFSLSVSSIRTRVDLGGLVVHDAREEDWVSVMLRRSSRTRLAGPGSSHGVARSWGYGSRHSSLMDTTPRAHIDNRRLFLRPTAERTN